MLKFTKDFTRAYKKGWILKSFNAFLHTTTGIVVFRYGLKKTIKTLIFLVNVLLKNKKDLIQVVIIIYSDKMCVDAD